MTASSTPDSPGPTPTPRKLSDVILDGVVALLLTATLFLSFLQVIARYILHFSTPWSEELARLLFVWGVFLGAAVGVKRNLHTRVDFLLIRFPTRAGRLVLAGMDLLLAGMAVVMVVYGGQLVFSTRADFSTSLGYPRNWFYAPVPVAGLFMLWYLVRRVIGELRHGSLTPPRPES